MNFSRRTIKYYLIFLISPLLLYGQDNGNFKLSISTSSGVNYTYSSNLSIPGTYKKNSIPVTGGLELLYKNTFALEINSGYYPVMFFSGVRKYKGSDILVDASLISYPVSFILKYHLGHLVVEAGASYCILKSGISLTGVENESVSNSFGYMGGVIYQIGVFKNFNIEPGIELFKIKELNSSTLTFKVGLRYSLLTF